MYVCKLYEDPILGRGPVVIPFCIELIIYPTFIDRPHQFFGQPTCLNLAVPRTPLQISSCYFLGNRNLAGSLSRLGASILACRTTRFVFPACSERPPSIRGRSCAFACFCAFVFTYNIAQIFSRKGFPVSESVIHYNTQDYRKILVRLQKHA